MAINSGSSSLKFQLFSMPEEKLLVKGLFERIGLAKEMTFSYQTSDEKAEHTLPHSSHEKAVDYLLHFLLEKKFLSSLEELSGVGHRVAHGGEYFSQATPIHAEEIAKIEELSILAPLHNPVNLIGIRAFQTVLPNCLQVAVFDTAFHQTMAEKEYIYPLPMKYYRDYHIRKYGFHGTSHQYVAMQAAEKIGVPFEELKIISCHLGNGASICGIKDGKSVITSMGFTPLAGLMMGTRCGDIDPSILPYLQEKLHLTTKQINVIINEESGLLGVSELSNDSRDLVRQASEGVHQAKLALDIFTSRVRQTIAGYAGELGGFDVLIFTAGIGENSSIIRQKSCEGLECLSIELDQEKNQKNECFIQKNNGKPYVLVIPTNEELMIAREVSAHL